MSATDPTPECRGKIAYETRDAALAVIRSLRRAQRVDVNILSAYRCDGCGEWHLGRDRRRFKWRDCRRTFRKS